MLRAQFDTFNQAELELVDARARAHGRQQQPLRAARRRGRDRQRAAS